MSELVIASTVVPPRLRCGDTVAIPAPAGAVERAELQAGIEVLQTRYRVRIDAGLYEHSEELGGMLAGSDQRRADELNRYIRDPDVRAIVCARGGYGVMRILPLLDADALRDDPKLIVGYSDVTALHSWALRCAGVRSVHGPVVMELGRLRATSAHDLVWLFRLLEEAAPLGPVPASLTPVGRVGRSVAHGPLLGGNLSLLTHLIGTPYALSLVGAVAFIEDVGEAPYAIDRSLTQLGLAGAFAGVRAVAVGQMVRCNGLGDPHAVVADRLAAFGLFGVWGVPTGHGARHIALPLGAACELDPVAGTLVLQKPQLANGAAVGVRHNSSIEFSAQPVHRLDLRQ